MFIGEFNGPVEARFTNIFVHRRERVECLRALIYTDYDGEWFIPVGSISDGASLPWWLWWFCPPLGRELRAAWLHDTLLAYRFGPGGQTLTRVEIDRKFREALRCLGVPQWKRNLLWLGVRYQALATGDK